MVDKNKLGVAHSGGRWYIGTVEEGEDGIQLVIHTETNETISFETKDEAETFIKELQ